MSRHESELTDAQWVYIAPLLPEVKASPKGGANRFPIGLFLKGSCGCYAVGPVGKICRIGIPPPVPAGAAYAPGKTRMSGERPGARCSNHWMSGANSTGPKPSPMAALPRRKKGGLCRKNQTWKGYEVDGGGRRPRYSSGKLLGIGVPVGSHLD